MSLLGYCASREAVHLEAPPQSALKSPIVPATGGKSIYIEPTTSLELPTTLPPTASLLPQGSGPLVLVGAGVRTVSFLSIRVYVAALYVDAKALKEGGALRNLPDWKSYGKNRLLEGPKGEESAVSGEQLVKQLVDSGVPMVIRIGKREDARLRQERMCFVRIHQECRSGQWDQLFQGLFSADSGAVSHIHCSMGSTTQRGWRLGESLDL